MSITIVFRNKKKARDKQFDKLKKELGKINFEIGKNHVELNVAKIIIFIFSLFTADEVEDEEEEDEEVTDEEVEDTEVEDEEEEVVADKVKVLKRNSEIKITRLNQLCVIDLTDENSK
jgi:hypothetical protein